jgi:hypothetical protein
LLNATPGGGPTITEVHSRCGSKWALAVDTASAHQKVDDRMADHPDTIASSAFETQFVAQPMDDKRTYQAECFTQTVGSILQVTFLVFLLTGGPVLGYGGAVGRDIVAIGGKSGQQSAVFVFALLVSGRMAATAQVTPVSLSFTGIGFGNSIAWWASPSAKSRA